MGPPPRSVTTRLGVRGRPGTRDTLGHLKRVGNGGGSGRAAGCSGSAWGSHGAHIPRGPAAEWLPAIGDSAPAGGDAPLSSRDPATPSSGSVFPTVPTTARGIPAPAPGALRFSLCPHLLGSLNRFRCRSGLSTL